MITFNNVRSYRVHLVMKSVFIACFSKTVHLRSFLKLEVNKTRFDIEFVVLKSNNFYHS